MLQADQDVFGMRDYLSGVSCSTFQKVFCTTTGRRINVLRKCIRQGLVVFAYYRKFLIEGVDLWRSIRPFIRYTGHPDAKGKADSVSVTFCLVFFLFASNFLLGVCLLRLLFALRILTVVRFPDEGD